jgi:hypothetical protein
MRLLAASQLSQLSQPRYRRALYAAFALLVAASCGVVLVSSGRAARSTTTAAIVAEPVVAPPVAVVVDDADPPPSDEPFGPPAPPRRVLLTQSRVTPAITRTALEVLRHPMGSEVVRKLGDHDYAFVVEHHYHAPDSGLTPVGWHKGVTVYALEP